MTIAKAIQTGTFLFIRLAPLSWCLSRPFQSFLYHIYFHFWCPGSDKRVHECIAAGECGCNNTKKPPDRGG
jgi:hypothetical protein